MHNNHLCTLFSLLLLLCGITPMSAQEIEAPNYDLIRQQISNSRSASYYPLLMQRFQQCDTTLTLEDYRNLYFGFALREDYIPYQKPGEAVLEARARMALSKADTVCCPAALQTALSTLQDNPFDLPALSLIPICYYQLGDMENYHLWDSKLHGILDAIGSTGDGESAETAFHVINVEHEYEIINRLGLELDQVEVVNHQIDFVRVKQMNDSVLGIYFNYGIASQLFSSKYADSK